MPPAELFRRRTALCNDRSLSRRLELGLPEYGCLTEQAGVIRHGCECAGFAVPFDIAHGIAFHFLKLSLGERQVSIMPSALVDVIEEFYWKNISAGTKDPISDVHLCAFPRHGRRLDYPEHAEMR
jgi:hypothetical protein